MACTGNGGYVPGFICAHLALITFIVALAGQAWVIGNTTDTSDMTNTTCQKGLWVSNCGKPDSIVVRNHTEVQIYYRISEYFYVFSALNCLVSVLLTYMLLCCCHNQCCNGFLTAIQGMSTIEAAVALTLIGVSFRDENTFPADYSFVNLGWTYWVAVASGGLMFFATIFNGCHSRNKVEQIKMRQHYERI